MSRKIPLSVIILYDSSAPNTFLTQARESVKVFSELILYDVGATPIQNFAEVRNQAVKKATHEYVFFLDSDEVLSKDSIKHIEHIVTEKKYDLISVTRSDVFLGKQLQYGEAGQIGLVRFGKKEKMVFHRAVHETVVVKPTYAMIGSKIRIMHYAHASIESFFKKITYYSYLESQLRKRQSQPFSLFELLFFPPLKFLFNFFIKQGYRDGIRGCIYAIMMSLHSFFVRVYLFESQIEKSQRS